MSIDIESVRAQVDAAAAKGWTAFTLSIPTIHALLDALEMIRDALGETEPTAPVSGPSGTGSAETEQP